MLQFAEPDRYRAHQSIEKLFHDCPTRFRVIDGMTEMRPDGDYPVEDHEFQPGEMVEFSIDLSPVRRRSKRPEGGARPARPKRTTAIRGRDDQLAWLGPKLFDQAGVVINPETVVIHDLDPVINDPKGAFFKYMVRFSGSAIVIDRARLVSALQTGVGTSRAYGLGMLVINSAD